MNILLLTAHSIAEFDDLRMLHELGYNVFSIGAYTNPAEPADDKRPALPEVPYHADLAALVEGDQMAHKANLPDGLLDWADTVIVHHFPERWIAGNWPKYQAHRNRVIWRTCGQSNPQLEAFMASGRADGLQIVRYSPKERNLPNYAGEDALIRFGKEPDEWSGWHGRGLAFEGFRDLTLDSDDLDPYEEYPEDGTPFIANVTQNMKQRGDACGYGFWQAATDGLVARPAGPGSEEIGGVGNLTYDEMRAYLRGARVYLYTGTQPASYTLGLIEAMMTGVPVVSIGPRAFGGDSWVADVFEGHEITQRWMATPSGARIDLGSLLAGVQTEALSTHQRQRAIDLFGMEKVKEAWRAYLG